MSKRRFELITTGDDRKAKEAKTVAEASHLKKSLTPLMNHILEEAQRELSKTELEREDEDGAEYTSEELLKLVKGVSDRLGYEISSFERDEILAHLERAQNTFSVLKPLIEDESVSDIIIENYASISIQAGRSNIKTDLSFSSPRAYEAWVERLLQKAQSTYSTKKPIADGMVGDNVRLHAVHRTLCESGPYVTLRINRFNTVSLNDLLRFGLAPEPLLNHLKVNVQVGNTLLIVGEVGTGKTTLARALASDSIPETESILVIEDTPEIQLEHPHVRYIRTREANADGEGRVAPAECIRAGMRMAMNRIIFGEMRDAEAAESFVDVCASGHPGLSTIHAKSASEAITRLELFLGRAQPGVGRTVLNDQIATAVQVICFVDVCKQTRKRRIMEVIEISGAADGKAKQREIFRYEPKDSLPAWRVVNRISAFQEEFEKASIDHSLSSLPATISLPDDVLYREVSRPKGARYI